MSSENKNKLSQARRKPQLVGRRGSAVASAAASKDALRAAAYAAKAGGAPPAADNKVKVSSKVRATLEKQLTGGKGFFKDYQAAVAAAAAPADGPAGEAGPPAEEAPPPPPPAPRSKAQERLEHATLGRGKPSAARRRPTARKYQNTLPHSFLAKPAEVDMTDEQLDALQAKEDEEKAAAAKKEKGTAGGHRSRPSLVLQGGDAEAAMEQPSMAAAGEDDDLPALVDAPPGPLGDAGAAAAQAPPPPPPRRRGKRAAVGPNHPYAPPAAAAAELSPMSERLQQRASLRSAAEPVPADGDSSDSVMSDCESVAEGVTAAAPAGEGSVPEYLRWKRQVAEARERKAAEAAAPAAAPAAGSFEVILPAAEAEEEEEEEAGEAPNAPPPRPPRPTGVQFAAAAAMVAEQPAAEAGAEEVEAEVKPEVETEEEPVAAEPVAEPVPEPTPAEKRRKSRRRKSRNARRRRKSALKAAEAAGAASDSTANEGEQHLDQRDEDKSVVNSEDEEEMDSVPPLLSPPPPAAAAAAAPKTPSSRRPHKRIQSALSPAMERGEDGQMRWEGERRYAHERELFSRQVELLRERARTHSVGFGNATQYAAVLQSTEEQKCQVLGTMLGEAEKVNEFATGTTADACWSMVREHFVNMARRDMSALAELRESVTIPMSTAVSEVDVDIRALFAEADTLREECDTRQAELAATKASYAELLSKYRALSRVAEYQHADGEAGGAGAAGAAPSGSGAKTSTLKKKDQLTESRSACDTAHLAVVEAETKFRSVVRVYEQRMPVIVGEIARKTRSRMNLFKGAVMSLVRAQRDWIENVSDSLDRVQELTQGIDIDADVEAFSRGAPVFHRFFDAMTEATRPPSAEEREQELRAAEERRQLAQQMVYSSTSTDAGATDEGTSHEGGGTGTAPHEGGGAAAEGFDGDGDEERKVADEPPAGEGEGECECDSAPSTEAAAVPNGTAAAGDVPTYASKLWGAEGFATTREQAEEGKRTVKALTSALLQAASLVEAKGAATLKTSATLLKPVWPVTDTTEARAWATMADNALKQAPLHDECAAALREKANYLSVSKTEQKNAAAVLVGHKTQLQRRVEQNRDAVRDAERACKQRQWAYDAVVHEMQNSRTYEVCKTQAHLERLLARVSRHYAEKSEAATALSTARRTLAVSETEYELVCGHLFNLYQQQHHKRLQDCADALTTLAAAMETLNDGVATRDLSSLAFVSSIDLEADLLAMARDNATRVRSFKGVPGLDNGGDDAAAADGGDDDDDDDEKEAPAPHSAGGLDLFSYMGPVAYERMHKRLDKGAQDLKTLIAYVEQLVAAEMAECKGIQKHRKAWRVETSAPSLRGALAQMAQMFDSTVMLVQDEVRCLQANVLQPMEQHRRALKDTLAAAQVEHKAITAKLADAAAAVARTEQDERRHAAALTAMQTKYNRTKGKVELGKSSVGKLNERKNQCDKLLIELNLARTHTAAAKQELARTERERDGVVAALVGRLKEADVERSERFRALTNGIYNSRRSHLKKMRLMVANLCKAAGQVRPLDDVQAFLAARASKESPPDMVLKHDSILRAFLEMSTDGVRHLEARAARAVAAAPSALSSTSSSSTSVPATIREGDDEEGEGCGDDADYGDDDDEKKEDEVGDISMDGQPPFGGRLVSQSVLPAVFFQATNYVRRCALTCAGLFRESARPAELERVRGIFRRGEPLPLSSKDVNPHAVAGILKEWLGVLEEPLVPYEHYQSLLALGRASKDSAPGARAAAARDAVAALPGPNRFVLAALVRVLAEVDKRSGENKMDAASLAVAFAPVVARSPSNHDMRTAWAPSMHQDVRDIMIALELLIQEHGAVFDEQ